ncbi:hypothetical protein C0416_00300 [bacterium]|nr:hypothetical protein [bacterium]
MNNNYNKKRGFSIPEVIVAISLVVLIILTATNLLVSSMRANRNNVNRIIAYNLAQEALEGFRNVRDSNWLQNQNWRGSDKYNFFGENFFEDGKYIIGKKHSLFKGDECTQPLEFVNSVETVRYAAPWEISIYSDEGSKLYYGGVSNYTEYTHQIGANFSGFKRWVEIKTVPYQEASDEDADALKIGITAVVEWDERGVTKSIRVPTILTDWKSEN